MVTTHAIIIGNGFDLDLGWKTSYSDFIQSVYFQDLIEHESNDLALYLKEKKGLKDWIDIEAELSIYAQGGFYSTTSVENFESEFINLKHALLSYLENIRIPNLKRDTKSFELMNDLLKKNTKIFNFNYTNSVSTILAQLGMSADEIPQRLIHVHGTLWQKDIIVGVEDVANIKDDYVFLRKAYSPKFRGVDMIPDLSTAREIHFFGHSLGITDHTYFESFFDQLAVKKSGNASRKKIVFYYFKDEGYKNLLAQLHNLSRKRLTTIRQNHDFEFIDTSNPPI